MEILDTFGFNPILFGAQVINFLIIFFVLKKFLYKPLLKTMQTRQKRIEDGLTFAQETEARLEKIKKEEIKILKAAQAQSKELLSETRKQAQDILKSTQEQAKEETKKMIEDARAQIAKETKQAESRLMQQVGDVSIHFLEESLMGFFTEKEQQQIMAKALKRLEDKMN